MRAHPPRRSRLAALLLVPALHACAIPSAIGGLPRPGASPSGTLREAFADTALDHAHWGVLVRSLETGETVYAQNQERLFVPASNMKLITGATVLEALGPDYRYRTRVGAGGPVHEGVLQGPLVVWGTGDPTLSTRFDDDPRARFRAWADSLRARGIERIRGGVVGVDSAFVGPSLGAGWAWDDLDAYYAAEFGALQFNEGVIRVQLFPGRQPGDPVVAVLDPATQYVPVVNHAVTAARHDTTRVRIERDPSGPGLIVTGRIAAGAEPVQRNVAVRDPTTYFLSVLRETLREEGIAVEGQPLDADELPLDDLSVRRAWTLFVHESPPLRDILPAMMKPSQNWIAETLLRTAGLELRGEGSARAGREVADSLFQLWGLETDELRIADGSGLSRFNLVSPELLVGLLRHMTHSPNWEVWYASLPVAGVDGTLERRLRGTPLQGNVHAKTGTLTGVRSLSGYLDTPRGERLLFSILVNNHARSSADVDRVVDAALQRIVAGHH